MPLLYGSEVNGGLFLQIDLHYKNVCKPMKSNRDFLRKVKFFRDPG